MDKDRRDHLREWVNQGDRLDQVLDHDQFQALLEECRQAWEAQLLALDPLDPDFGLKARHLRSKVDGLQEFHRGLQSARDNAYEARLELQGLKENEPGPLL